MLEYSARQTTMSMAPNAAAMYPQTKLELPPDVSAWAMVAERASQVTLVQNDMNRRDQMLKFRFIFDGATPMFSSCNASWSTVPFAFSFGTYCAMLEWSAMLISDIDVVELKARTNKDVKKKDVSRKGESSSNGGGQIKQPPIYCRCQKLPTYWPMAISCTAKGTIIWGKLTRSAETP